MAKVKSKGLGDTVEKVTKATGIDKAVKFLKGEDCGCEERKELLNKMFPYKNEALCLVEQEYKFLTGYFENEQKKPKPSTANQVRVIHSRIFGETKQESGCDECYVTQVNELRKLFKEYAPN